MNRINPKPGQESVWDYPRPPRLEPTRKHLKIIFNGELIAETNSSYRVLETSHPPVYYFPPYDVRPEFLAVTTGTTVCEWKGRATYFDVRVGRRGVDRAAWSYSEPTQGFIIIKSFFAFYPSKMDACFVDNELVRAQAGDFFGGWITDDIVGPFKGEDGTWGW